MPFYLLLVSCCHWEVEADVYVWPIGLALVGLGHWVRLLLVEDEADMAQFVAKNLKQHGFSVDISHDGEDGLFMATHEEYDLVILDLMLPKLNGLTPQRTAAPGWHWRRTGRVGRHPRPHA